MTAGSHPDRARFFMGPRTLGLQVSQTTHTPAAFSIDMIVASRPDRSRAPRLHHQDESSVQPIEVVIFLSSWAANSNRFLSLPVDIGLGDNDIAVLLMALLIPGLFA